GKASDRLQGCLLRIGGLALQERLNAFRRQITDAVLPVIATGRCLEFAKAVDDISPSLLSRLGQSILKGVALVISHCYSIDGAGLGAVGTGLRHQHAAASLL